MKAINEARKEAQHLPLVPADPGTQALTQFEADQIASLPCCCSLTSRAGGISLFFRKRLRPRFRGDERAEMFPYTLKDGVHAEQ
jgi:hypothetical protein